VPQRHCRPNPILADAPQVSSKRKRDDFSQKTTALAFQIKKHQTLYQANCSFIKPHDDEIQKVNWKIFKAQIG
jgi:hypothetical protein